MYVHGIQKLTLQCKFVTHDARRSNFYAAKPTIYGHTIQTVDCKKKKI